MEPIMPDGKTPEKGDQNKLKASIIINNDGDKMPVTQSTASSATLSKPANISDISINFTPKIGTSPEKTTVLPSVTSTTSPSASNLAPKTSAETPQKPIIAKPEILTIDIKKNDLEKQKNDFFNNSSLLEKSGGSTLMENITSQKMKIEKPKIDDLLGKQSKILEKTIEQETLLNYKKRLRVVQFMAFFVFMVVLGINTFLYTQLSPGLNIAGLVNYNFDSNLRNDVFNLNKNLRSVQTELNTYRFLTGQLYLNQFGYESTRFFDAVNQYTNSSNISVQADMAKTIGETKELMPKFLQGAKDNLTKSLIVETYLTRGEGSSDEQSQQNEFQQSLKNAILDKKKAKLAAKSEINNGTDSTEAVFYDNSARLVGNSKLINNLQSTSLDNFKSQVDLYADKNFDVSQRESFKKSVDSLLDTTKVNLATINNIKNQRIKWSAVIDRIESITNGVNSGHNDINSNSSKIDYSSIEINSDTGKISISGTNTTRNGTNREVVTYLLDALEASPEFKNASNRSYPLTKATSPTGQDSYQMSFKIDMELEKGAFSKQNAPISDLSSSKPKLTAKALVKTK